MPRALQVLAGGALTLPSACVDDESANALLPLGVTKTRHLHRAGTNFGQLVGDAPTTREMIVYHCAAPATVKNFRALLEETGTSTGVTYDLKKYNDANPTGLSIIASVVSITHATGDRVAGAGAISTPALEAGDVLTIVQTMTTNTGAAGPWAEVEVDEPLV